MNTKLLKQKILDLAIRGKLTQQLESDGTARELLEQISSKVSSSSSTLSSPRRRGSPSSSAAKTIIPLDKSEAPFEIPANWEWVRLGDVGKTITGATPSKNHPEYEGDEIPFLSPGDISQANTITSYESQGLSKQGKILARPVPANTVLQVCIGGSIGKCAIVDREVCFNQQINSISVLIAKYEYIYAVLQSLYFQNEIILKATGTATPIINKSSWDNLLVPLPPLAEQQRIVEKIEEAFAEIDAIEKNKELLKTHIKQTRQKILDLAIHGKLVPQNKSDEPASVLLERITRDNPHYEKLTDIPFEIPESWEWIKLMNVCEDFIVPQRDKPTEFTGNIPWCRIEDIEGKYLNGSRSHQLVTKELADKMNMHLCPKGTVISACSASIGNQAITTVDCYTNQTFIGIVCNKTLLFNEYLYYFLESQSKKLKEMGKGTTIGYISRKKYEDYAFPLPPLAEQKRIVNKIEEIFASLDEISLHLV